MVRFTRLSYPLSVELLDKFDTHRDSDRGAIAINCPTKPQLRHKQVCREKDKVKRGLAREGYCCTWTDFAPQLLLVWFIILSNLIEVIASGCGATLYQVR